MEQLFKRYGYYKLIVGTPVLLVDKAILSLEWKLGILICFLLIFYVIDNYAIHKERKKHSIEATKMASELNDLKKKIETSESLIAQQNKDFFTLNKRYSRFVNVEFKGIASSLKDFYDDFKIKHRGKTGLKEDVDELKIISKTTNTLLLKETEELKHVKGDLSRSSHIE